MTEQGRWAGRNPGKDVVRNQVWHSLEQTGVAVGPAELPRTLAVADTALLEAKESGRDCVVSGGTASDRHRPNRAAGVADVADA